MIPPGVRVAVKSLCGKEILSFGCVYRVGLGWIFERDLPFRIYGQSRVRGGVSLDGRGASLGPGGSACEKCSSEHFCFDDGGRESY